MGVDFRSKVLLGLGVMGILALLAVPWILRLREERLGEDVSEPRPKLSTLLPPEASADAPGTGGSGPETPAEPSRPEDSPRPHPVDLTALRERLPDNLYWSMGVPTKDPDLLRWREEQERYWYGLNGKVLSNTATEEEIHTYYAHRQRVSEDFMRFAAAVLDEYGDRLPETERGLYELSIRMHRTRLEELPRQVEEALARKRAQDQRREAWLRASHP
jgi:hypothetical protein